VWWWWKRWWQGAAATAGARMRQCLGQRVGSLCVRTQARAAHVIAWSTTPKPSKPARVTHGTG
jgi:hypothetical protein